jgi:hypothetical protein
MLDQRPTRPRPAFATIATRHGRAAVRRPLWLASEGPALSAQGREFTGAMQPSTPVQCRPPMRTVRIGSERSCNDLDVNTISKTWGGNLSADIFPDRLRMA